MCEMNLNLAFKQKKLMFKIQCLVPANCRMDDLEYVEDFKERIQQPL